MPSSNVGGKQRDATLNTPLGSPDTNKLSNLVSGLADAAMNSFKNAKSELGVATTEPILALGLWMDGVPCNWDRTDSLEVFSLNFPGISPLSH